MRNGSNSAEMEREVAAQRHRVESTIDQIREKLSPGQLVDEVLSYTKNGGKDFASSLGHTATANPVPTALLGISLAWLMFGSKKDGMHADHQYDSYARVNGDGLQRISHAQDELGDWYSEFIDESGRKYRAKSNALGERAGHFVDETGKNVRGFLDNAGRRIDGFRDEAGNVLDQSMGWASQVWDDATSGMQNASESAAHLAGDMRHQAERFAGTAMRTLENQPLIAGALAFAAGAALGGVLPSTREEDELLGRYSDDVKREASRKAGEMYEDGKEEAARLYEEASGKAGEIYSDAKHKLAGEETVEGRPRAH